MAEFNAAWWWIDRWRKSSAYTDMTLAEQGAYRNLLDELWLRGGVIPDDDRILARASAAGIDWPKVKGAVLARFDRTPEGLRNETHDEIAAASRARREKLQELGKRRAETAKRGADGRFGPTSAAGQSAQRDDQRTTPATLDAHAGTAAGPSSHPPSPSPSPSPDQSPSPLNPPTPPLGKGGPVAESGKKTRRRRDRPLSAEELLS